MMYLVHYDRSSSLLVEIREFANRDEANQARADLELSLLCTEGTNEIVLLEADSLDSLKNTHSRYFSSFDEIAQKRSDSVQAENANRKTSGKANPSQKSKK